MKRPIKKLVRTLWLISAPVYRPVIRNFDQHVMELLRAVHPPAPVPADLDLALCSIVRELARLQIQVEILQQQIGELQSNDRTAGHTERRLSVVGEND